MNLEYLTINNNKIKVSIVFHREIFHHDSGYFYEKWNEEIFKQY